MRRSWCLTSIAVCIFGCGSREATPTPPPVPDAAVEASPHDKELTALWELEKQQRKSIDFATLPPSDHALGSDPYQIVGVRDRFVGVLRGEGAVVLLDRTAKELARVPLAGAVAIAVLPDDDVLAIGETGGFLQLRIADDKLERISNVEVAGLIDARGIAVSSDGKTAYVVEERDGRLLAFALARSAPNRGIQTTPPRELGRCRGPIGVKTLGDVIATNCLLDRAIEIRRGDVVTKIQHDGPMWGFDLHRDKRGTMLLAAGGVEDHPLERADGGFGYVDSFLFLYELTAGTPTRLAAINLSEHRGITPKWIELFEDADRLGVETAGFGGGRHIVVSWPGGKLDAAPRIDAWPLPPGITGGAKLPGGPRILASSLFDAWVVQGVGTTLVAAGTPSTRTTTEKLGELLFFTELMAPWGKTDGKLSRFTCETCHHEGYTDGRTHYTGREHGGLKVNATTRPLLGLFNNAPYFSRALDSSMTQMVHSEFKVANRHNGRDPWFQLTDRDVDWWTYLGVGGRVLPPELLREAFMRFLIQFTHRSNAAANHAAFTASEQRGAEVFRDRCASCHAARLIAEEPATEVPFDRWQKLVLSPSGPLVWNTAAYAKTGVLPYVHDDGTRIPTLRRLYKKSPYFTNGSARSLADVLDRFAYDTTGHHDQVTPAMTKLTADDKTALLAFLKLL